MNRLKVVIAVAGLGLMVPGCSLSDTGEAAVEQDTASVTPRLPDEAVRQCVDLVDKLVARGVARRPTPERLDVDEGEWATLESTAKVAVMTGLACAVYGRSELADLEYVVIYGRHSGKRLAMLGSTGADFGG